MKQLFVYILAFLCIPACTSAAAGAGAGKAISGNNTMHSSVLNAYIPIVALQQIIAQYLCAYHQTQVTEIPFNISDISSTYNQKELITQNSSFQTGKRSLALWHFKNNNLMANTALEVAPIQIQALSLSSRFIGMLTVSPDRNLLNMIISSREAHKKQNNMIPAGAYIFSLFETENNTFFVLANYQGIVLYKETAGIFSSVQEIPIQPSKHHHAISHNGFVIVYLNTQNALSLWQFTQLVPGTFEYKLKLNKQIKNLGVMHRMILSPNGEYLALQPKENTNIIIENLHSNQQQVIKSISGQYANTMHFSPNNLHFYVIDNTGITIWQNNQSGYIPFQKINGKSPRVISTKSDDLCLIGQLGDQDLKILVWRYYAKELEQEASSVAQMEFA